MQKEENYQKCPAGRLSATMIHRLYKYKSKVGKEAGDAVNKFPPFLNFEI